MRDRLGLRAGADLEIQETAMGIVLTPADRKPSLIRKGSFLVHTGEIPSGYDVLGAINEDRDERGHKAWACELVFRHLSAGFGRNVLVRGDENFKASRFGCIRELAILHSGQLREARCLTVIAGKQEPQALVNAFIEQQPH